MSIPTVAIQARRTASAGRRQWGGVAGAVLLTLTLFVAFLGPLLPPYGPEQLLDAPYSPRSGHYQLGTDYLGRDVLSRVLAGGWKIILLATALTLIAYVIGMAIGLVSALARHRWVDTVWMRAMDALIAFPPLLLLLVLAAGLGSGYKVIVLGTVLLHVPGIARLIRSSGLAIAKRGFVEAATARGDRLSQIIRREMVPNLIGTIVADGGPRLTASIFLIAGLSFLGLGAPPGAPDWAVMISENRPGLGLNSWAVAAPAAMIGLLTLGVNICADSLAGRMAKRA